MCSQPTPHYWYCCTVYINWLTEETFSTPLRTSSVPCHLFFWVCCCRLHISAFSHSVFKFISTLHSNSKPVPRVSESNCSTTQSPQLLFNLQTPVNSTGSYLIGWGVLPTFFFSFPLHWHHRLQLHQVSLVSVAMSTPLVSSAFYEFGDQVAFRVSIADSFIHCCINTFVA